MPTNKEKPTNWAEGFMRDLKELENKVRLQTLQQVREEINNWLTIPYPEGLPIEAMMVDIRQFKDFVNTRLDKLEKGEDD